MTFKERWESAETDFWKKVKYLVGYSGMFGGVILDLAKDYMPYVNQYIPAGTANKLFTLGLIAYGISKLSAKIKQDESKV